RTLAAAMRAIGGQFGSIMIPASVLMAVRVYDRASESMCPRFFGIFHSALTNQSSRSQARLKAGCGLVALHRIIVHFIARGGCHCRAAAQPAAKRGEAGPGCRSGCARLAPQDRGQLYVGSITATRAPDPAGSRRWPIEKAVRQA